MGWGGEVGDKESTLRYHVQSHRPIRCCGRGEMVTIGLVGQKLALKLRQQRV